MDDRWFTFFYQYGIGSAIFCALMFLLLKTKAIKLKRTYDRRIFYLLIAGLVSFMFIHGTWSLIV